MLGPARRCTQGPADRPAPPPPTSPWSPRTAPTTPGRPAPQPWVTPAPGVTRLLTPTHVPGTGPHAAMMPLLPPPSSVSRAPRPPCRPPQRHTGTESPVKGTGGTCRPQALPGAPSPAAALPGCYTTGRPLRREDEGEGHLRAATELSVCCQASSLSTAPAAITIPASWTGAMVLFNLQLKNYVFHFVFNNKSMKLIFLFKFTK